MQLSSDPGHGPPEAFPLLVLYIEGSIVVRGLLVGCPLCGTTDTPHETLKKLLT